MAVAYAAVNAPQAYQFMRITMPLCNSTLHDWVLDDETDEYLHFVCAHCNVKDSEPRDPKERTDDHDSMRDWTGED